MTVRNASEVVWRVVEEASNLSGDDMMVFVISGVQLFLVTSDDDLESECWLGEEDEA